MTQGAVHRAVRDAVEVARWRERVGERDKADRRVNRLAWRSVWPELWYVLDERDLAERMEALDRACTN